jgi:hypothetical protein
MIPLWGTHDPPSLVPITVVIPTRMRCPEPVSRQNANPLCQCLQSVLAQRSLPCQVIVVSSMAPDYTADSLRHYDRAFARRGVALGVVWVPDDAGLGPFGKIKLVGKLARNDLIHLVEDDVFLHPNCLATGYELMTCLHEKRPALALLSLPLYRRATVPTRVLGFREMGRLDERLRLTGCFESVAPAELIHSRTVNRYPRKHGFFAHEIDFFRGGNNLIRREALELLQSVRIGTPYGWELSAGLHLRRLGAELLYAPYQDAASMHSYYGAWWSRRTFLGKDWTRGLPGYVGASLRDVVRNAAKGKPNTGLGPLPLEVYYYHVATCYALILEEYAPRLVAFWLAKLRAEFVERVENDLTHGRQKIYDRQRRESIVMAALEAAVACTRWTSPRGAQEAIDRAFRVPARERAGRIEEASTALIERAEISRRRVQR